MESKLPKPTPVRKPMLPVNRIRAPNQMASTSSNNKIFSEFLLKPTIGQNHVFRERAISPDQIKSNHLQNRMKLRRSRSVCDLKEMHSKKRIDKPLAQMPMRNCITTQVLGKSMTSSTNIPNRLKRIVNSNNILPNTIPNKLSKDEKPQGRKANNNTIAGATASTSNSTNKKFVRSGSDTTVSTTGAGKPINKRIPPYDYKARYNDLVEKHKLLKSKFDEKTELLANLENMPEQLEDTKSQLNYTQEQLHNYQIDNEALKENLETTTNHLNKNTIELEELKINHNTMSKEFDALNTEVTLLRKLTADLTATNSQLLEENKLCKTQLFEANIERKQLHNTIMDLKGNIRVFCRVRPPLDFELDKQLCGWSFIDEATLEIINLDITAKNKGNLNAFNFDYVFQPATKQEEIFAMVSPLIQSALDGYNVCIFAYGQTGSGKTYTMDGVTANPGVIPRTVDLLFDAFDSYRIQGWEYVLHVQFLEIYNEVLYDLLSNEYKEMEIRMSKNNRNDIYVSNITRISVDNAEHLRELMNIAKMNRATACTMGNERSSRSHAVTKLELIGTHLERQETTIGSISLVDLAGSESPKTSVRMNETKNINRSLSELTNVILALVQKQDHVPYRNSKLTHLLMPCLGGNSKTLMFINVAPFQDCYVESVKSLRFASSVNQCKLAKAKRVRLLNNSMMNTN